MFDLITGNVIHAPRPRTAPVVVSILVHAAVVGAVFIGTVMLVTAPVPELPMMMAFVATPPAPPPPPPPPPPAAPKKPQAVEPLPPSDNAAPIEPPQAIEPEAPASAIGEGEEVTGVEGGVPGGVPGGVLGGLMPEIPAPPPPLPAPPPAPRKPVRIGGQIKEPTLIHRIQPEYPLLALARQLEGVVILEAIVDEEGQVESVKVLRSPGVFEQAALDAVRQWRYSPVILNGRPERFILTVVVSFHLEK